ncbi:MAG TPA: tRNA lysidine(34) synthetase TilS [Flavobacterium sp.]|nr:tRNA lysidine(34) synthetase TilS [Flavobacterium sp.]
MFAAFRQHLQRHFPFLEGKRLLLAVSGGVDSMVMATVCKESGLDLGIAHCNFSLRGTESEADAAFVRTFAKDRQLPFYLQRFDTKAFASDYGLSTQVAARQLRYDWFAELAAREGYDYILTAHHADDNLETFLIHLTRGTGLDGLTGIPAQNGNIIRPMLPFSREDIEAFAREHNVNWREDASNAADVYLRNTIRHNLVPVFKSLNPSLLSSFADTLAHLTQAQSLVDDAARIVYRKVVTDEGDRKIIALTELKLLPNADAYLYQWLKPLGFTAWSDIYRLIDAPSGKYVLAPGFRLLKDRDVLIVTPSPSAAPEVAISENITTLDNPVKLLFTPVDSVGERANTTIFVDRSRLRWPLTLRRWTEGDVLYPLGMEGRKKVSKYFKDEKFSLVDKEETRLLLSGNDLVWIVGHRQDARFAADETTRDILKISYLPNE